MTCSEIRRNRRRRRRRRRKRRRKESKKRKGGRKVREVSRMFFEIKRNQERKEKEGEVKEEVLGSF